MQAHVAISSSENDFDRSAAPRLALAGGSDQPPPGQDKASAEIIRFPIERIHPAKSDPAELEGDGPSAVDACPAGDGAVWAAWLTSVLSHTSTGGVGSER
jgi:hypothetical protein